MADASGPVAFLGLGVMGGSMAANLARAGVTVRAWNRTPGRPGAATAEAAGAAVVDTIEEAVADAAVVMVCVSDVPDVREVLVDEAGVVAHAASGALVVDFSTIGPAAAREIQSELAAAGLRFLDAPVTGGDVGARDGTLTIMAGGDEADFEEARPYLAHVGSNLFWCGPTGQGQATKLANQVLAAVNLIGVSEALVLAESLGADPAQVVEICSTGAGGSWALANLGPRILARDFEPGFMTRHMSKDLRLVAENSPDVALPGVDLAASKFDQTDPEVGTQAVALTYVAPSER